MNFPGVVALGGGGALGSLQEEIEFFPLHRWSVKRRRLRRARNRSINMGFPRLM
jgi:hypothetical protein